MAVLSPSFIFGVCALLYLTQFVVFAIIRITTGISIQRFGYLSLRRIAYTPRDGIRIDLRGLGLRLHRPTFAQPTYISLKLSELRITIDPVTRRSPSSSADGGNEKNHENARRDGKERGDRSSTNKSATSEDTWRKLTRLKDALKLLHDKIRWLSLFDVELADAKLVVPGVGEIQVGSAIASIDTRRQTVDRGRLFRHKKEPDQDKRPAEWMFVIKGILFTPEGCHALEIMDICTLNVHGLLYKNISGLRDVSVSIKIGRINIPYDRIVECRSALFKLRSRASSEDQSEVYDEVSMEDVVGELNKPGSREDSIVRTVDASREFMASFLRGIQEIQLAVSFIGFTKRIDGLQPTGRTLYANVSMNEIGIDLFRLDQKSPAHRMYFSPDDVAHQALIAAISLAVGLDDGQGKPERILYVPMTTSTIKTTLPSRTISTYTRENAAERNANMLFATLAVTSPSIDVDLTHLAVVLAVLQTRQQDSATKQSATSANSRLISRLLPKASIRFSVQEPVARVVLPTADKKLRNTDEYDLLISSISSISLDVESSHNSGGDLHYALTSTLRTSSQQLYYQAASGARHNVLLVEDFGLKLQLAATPEISAVVTGSLDTVSVHLVRPEIGKGIRRILQQVRSDPDAEQLPRDARALKSSFLRRLPPWLVNLQMKGTNFGVEAAGTDDDVSEHLRGLALQLRAFNLDYKVQKSVASKSYRPKSEFHGGPISPDETFSSNPFLSGRRSVGESTDGRKLSVSAQGFEGFIVEDVDAWEPHSFLSVPRAEASFTTTSDDRGPTFNVHGTVKAVYLEYSLYRYYALGIATVVLRKAFNTKTTTTPAPTPPAEHEQPSLAASRQHLFGEAVTLDLRVPFIQVKATMPSDPQVMLQVYGLDLSRHRWATPFVKTQLIRLYAQSPRIRQAWAKILSIKSARIDVREATRITKSAKFIENSIDVQTEFVRIAVPHQLVMYRVFDNFVNTVKATQQLHHRFITESNDYVLQKTPEGPKKLPKISLRSRSLMFELEDSGFDWRLDLIYRVGLKEQKQRLAREDAYRLKIKKMVEQQNQRRDQTRMRAPPKKAARGRNGAPSPSREGDDGASIRSRGRRRSSYGLGRNAYDKTMRYDADAGCMLTEEAKVTADEAWISLQQYNASSWKKRISLAMRNQAASVQDFRRHLWGNDDLPEEAEEPETVIAIPSRPGLMTALIHDFHIVVDKPSFPIDDYPKFLHEIGKGMPYDTQYSLLIPLNIQLNMGETKMSLRNYPLPLLHVPALKPGQSTRLPTWSLKTDFVIAEEFRDTDSIRHVKVEIVPPPKITDPPQVAGGFAIDVRRTVMPVKTYSNIDVTVNTSAPTTFTWGTSYQPAIQDMMQIIESFTRPQVDPSEKVGFWDKIRLSFHSRARIAWKGNGDVHLKLKGTRDPYNITGFGAGFVWCFRQGVCWDLHQTDDPREFMTVSCGEYVWAVPDYSEQARYTDFAPRDNDSISSRAGRPKPEFKKVIMKLSGNVRWLAGLMFERELADGTRSFDFDKHYTVTTKTPEAAKKLMPKYDAFGGFRSSHIHLSIAVVAPVDRDWSVNNTKPSSGYNTVHLTPRFFTHFFDWWSTFQGSMSLPIRQGPLFPGVEKSSKKFGRHLATIKYNLLLSPLFISHIYKHKDADEWNDDVVRATGLKVRLDSFMLDMHQRRETFATQKKAKGKSGMTSGMKINQAQLDFINADFRAVSSNIGGTSPETLKTATEDDLSLLNLQHSPAPDTSNFTIPDKDYVWVDMDDFVELDWMLPAEKQQDVKIMPLAFSPRFTYFRQTEHNGMVAGDASRTSRFGDEPTHFCVMSQEHDPRHVQRDLIEQRLQILAEQIKQQEKIVHDQEEKLKSDPAHSDKMNEDYEELRNQIDILREKKAFMEDVMADLSSTLNANPTRNRASSVGGESMTHSLNDLANEAAEGRREQSQPRAFSRVPDYGADFNNRFTVHNVQLKWNNSLRDIILRYVHQVSQRRGFTYYMTRSAVKFILDILDEQQRKQKRGTAAETRSESRTPMDTESPATPAAESFAESEVSDELKDRIDELMKDGRNIVDALDANNDLTPSQSKQERKEQAIAEEFTAVNSYHVRLIAPQIQMQSDKNSKAALLVTAHGMELKVIQIMDKNRLADDISGLVQRRISVDMNGVQFFVTTQKAVSKYLSYYAHLHYGTPKGSVWPPWAPLEVNFDSSLNPFGWYRVVQETSINVRYEKFNNLRLKYNNEVTSNDDSSRAQAIDEVERRMDHISVEFPHVRVICDSTQYYSIFLIVSDLLLFSEPLEKMRNERLEKIMLAADFSDLSGTPEMVGSLQARIHQLEEIRDHFHLHANRLDRKGWEDRFSIDRDLSICEEELFFMMKAITSAQQKFKDQSDAESNGLMRWNISASEIVWHLIQDEDVPLAEFQLMNAMFDRTDNSDGSNHNMLEIGRIFGLNLLPDAIFPQMIAPYDGKGTENALAGLKESDIKMLRVNWHMLEAIAGIPVLDNFEVNLFPLKIQLERNSGKKLFEYVFPPSGSDSSAVPSPFMAKRRPTMADDEDSDVDLAIPESPASESPNNEPDTRAGSMELRFRPTLTLGDLQPRPSTAGSWRHKASDAVAHHRLSPFPSRDRSTSRSRASVKSTSTHSSTKRVEDSASTLNEQTEASNASIVSSRSERTNRFKLKRSNTSRTISREKDKPNDDLTEMMNRASNYMTLSYVKIPSVILCLSYKGKNERNFVDVHDFVFTMPTIEYRNKTWSNMDLVLRLKKDVIKALVSHTGAIIGNKFAHHRPNKYQQSKLRELATSSSLLPNTNNITNTLVKTATRVRQRTSDKHQSDQTDVIEEETMRDDVSFHGGDDGTATNGHSGIPKMAVNGRTFHLSSPSSTASIEQVADDRGASSGHERPPTRPSTKGSGLGSASSIRSSPGSPANTDDDSQSTKKNRRSTVRNLGKMIFNRNTD